METSGKRKSPSGNEIISGEEVKVPRCNSPSHFFVSKEEENAVEPSQLKYLPERTRINNVLRAVSSTYYCGDQMVESIEGDDKVEKSKSEFQYSTLDSLLSPLRKPTIFDKWTNREIALFESGMCSFGKDFHAISKLFKTGTNTCSKTTQDVVEMYYHWKKSAHYDAWKKQGRNVKKLPLGKQELWNMIDSKMAAYINKDKSEK